MSGTPARIPLTVVGGYLGAGKTTLVNAVVRARPGRLAVLVNDFGAIAVDPDLVADHDGATLTLANGCVCCSLADGFLTALTRVRELPGPIDRVLVEASGVADPRRVAQWGHSPGFVLDGVVVLVDAETAPVLATDRYVGDTVRTQVAGGDLVLLTKTDLAGPVGTAAARAWVVTVTPAAILEAPHGSAPLAVLLGGDDPDHPAGTHRVPPAAHPAYATAAVETGTPVARAALDAALDDLPPGLLRAKGVVTLTPDPGRPTDATAVVVHVVGRRVAVRPAAPGTPPGCRLVAIGVAPATSATLDAWVRRVTGPAPR